VLERRSALAHALQHSGRDGADGRRQLRLGEVRGWSLVQAAAFATTAQDLEETLRRLLGLDDIPARVGDTLTSGERRVMRIGPEQFWIIARDGEDLAPALRAGVPPALGAVTPLSHSRTCIFVEGAAARRMLSSIALDLHPDAFRRDSFALAVLHHTPVLIHRSGEHRYELYVLRTFALSAWEWLTDAALPFGYDVGEGGACR
jgi:methylglutamate dehydrogenase subunit D